MNVAQLPGAWADGIALLRWCEDNIGQSIVTNPDGWVGEGWLLEHCIDQWYAEFDDIKHLTIFLLRWT